MSPSFDNFRMSWTGWDVPYLAINVAFSGSDTELKNWRDILVYLRFRRADGEGRVLEGILPLGLTASSLRSLTCGGNQATLTPCGSST